MHLTVTTPAAAELPRIGELLSAWQADPWAGHLHPGDVGWRTLVGAAGTADALRVWAEGARPVAVGLLDDGVLRLALDPALTDDDAVAAAMADTLEDLRPEMFAGDGALVEARGAGALRRRPQSDGWMEDEPWSPLVLDLSRELSPHAVSAGLRIERVGPEAAEQWTGVHWSAFMGTPFEGDDRDLFVQRWVSMTTGPLAEWAQSLIGYDSQGCPVAVVTVWTAGRGRPGLIEPMGVHREHQGHGYGTAITVAGALALQQAGASSAVVAAEGSNPAAIATYRAAGFVSLGTVTDLRRAQHGRQPSGAMA